MLAGFAGSHWSSSGCCRRHAAGRCDSQVKTKPSRSLATPTRGHQASTPAGASPGGRLSRRPFADLLSPGHPGTADSTAGLSDRRKASTGVTPRNDWPPLSGGAPNNLICGRQATRYRYRNDQKACRRRFGCWDHPLNSRSLRLRLVTFCE